VAGMVDKVKRMTVNSFDRPGDGNQIKMQDVDAFRYKKVLLKPAITSWREYDQSD
jgi:hypothetical protein